LLPVGLWLLVVALVYLFLQYWLLLSEKQTLECGPLKRFFNLKSVQSLSLSLSHTHTHTISPPSFSLLCEYNQSKGEIELGVSSRYLFIFFLSFFINLSIIFYICRYVFSFNLI
jgi:hypothetical protein